MKQLLGTLIVLSLFGCKEEQKEKTVDMSIQNIDLEKLAFEGISVDFQFKSDKPMFGDLFLIVGYENPNFPPKSKQFEKLKDLGFEQVDDYFAIRNDTTIGDDIKLWLFPIINGEEVHHNKGPFDAIRINYVVIRNDTKNIDLFERTFNHITSTLNVTPIFNGKPVNNYNDIKETIAKAVQYCRQELYVEPGSDKALELEW